MNQNQAIVIQPQDKYVAPIGGADYDMLSRCANAFKAANDVPMLETLRGHIAILTLSESFDSPFIYDDGKEYMPGFEHCSMRPERLRADDIAFLNDFEGDKGNWGEIVAVLATIPNLRWAEIGDTEIEIAFKAQ